MNTDTLLSYKCVVLLLISYKRANGIIGYTRRPLDGYFCNIGPYINVGQFNQLACTRSCIISTTCMLLMYHPHNKTCFHLQGSQPCHLATPSPEIMIMRFRSSLYEQCLVPSNDRLVVTSSGRPHVLSRKYKDGVLCPGVSNSHEDRSFYFVGPEVTTVCPDAHREIMAVVMFVEWQRDVVLA